MTDIAELESQSIAIVEDYSSVTAVALNEAYEWFHEAVVIFFIALALNFILKWTLDFLQKRFAKKKSVWKEGFVKGLKLPLGVFIWAFAGVKAFDRITERMFTVSWIPNMTMIIGVLAVVCLTWFILRWKKYVRRNISEKGRHHRIPFDPSKIDVIDKLATIIIIFFATLFILEITGRSLATIIAFGGVGGLAIAFASQEIISNFFGGLMIYLTHPFAVGDWITLPEKDIEGHVEDIGWYMTRVRTFERRPIYIPNSIFTKMVVVNPTRMSHRRIKESVGLRYSDISKAKAIAEDIYKYLMKNPEIEPTEKNSVNVDNFGPYSLDIAVVAYTKTTDGIKFAEVKENVLLKIAEIVAKHGADFASPPYFEPGKS